jgi:mono/diheme cytochrome c family protein
MKTNVLIFVIGFILALGGGYLIWGMDGTDDSAESTTTAPAETETSDETDTEDADTESAGETVVDAEPLVENNCMSCHAVDSIGAEGGTTGPDLSDAYNTTEGKHGKPLDEFLKEPTSAVMSTVIEGDPLSDEEIDNIVEVLKAASENN